jgi:hypothetical protein
LISYCVDAPWPINVADESIASSLPRAIRSAFQQTVLLGSIACSTFFDFIPIAYTTDLTFDRPAVNPLVRPIHHGGQWLNNPPIPRAAGCYGLETGGSEYQPENDPEYE